MDKLIAVGKGMLVLWMGLPHTLVSEIVHGEPEFVLEDLIHTQQWH